MEKNFLNKNLKNEKTSIIKETPLNKVNLIFMFKKHEFSKKKYNSLSIAETNANKIIVGTKTLENNLEKKPKKSSPKKSIDKNTDSIKNLIQNQFIKKSKDDVRVISRLSEVIENKSIERENIRNSDFILRKKKEEIFTPKPEINKNNLRKNSNNIIFTKSNKANPITSREKKNINLLNLKNKKILESKKETTNSKKEIIKININNNYFSNSSYNTNQEKIIEYENDHKIDTYATNEENKIIKTSKNNKNLKSKHDNNQDYLGENVNLENIKKKNINKIDFTNERNKFKNPKNYRNSINSIKDFDIKKGKSIDFNENKNCLFTKKQRNSITSPSENRVNLIDNFYNQEDEKKINFSNNPVNKKKFFLKNLNIYNKDTYIPLSKNDKLNIIEDMTSSSHQRIKDYSNLIDKLKDQISNINDLFNENLIKNETDINKDSHKNKDHEIIKKLDILTNFFKDKLLNDGNSSNLNNIPTKKENFFSENFNFDEKSKESSYFTQNDNKLNINFGKSSFGSNNKNIEIDYSVILNSDNNENTIVTSNIKNNSNLKNFADLNLKKNNLENTSTDNLNYTNMEVLNESLENMESKIHNFKKPNYNLEKNNINNNSQPINGFNNNSNNFYNIYSNFNFTSPFQNEKDIIKLNFSPINKENNIESADKQKNKFDKDNINKYFLEDLNKDKIENFSCKNSQVKMNFIKSQIENNENNFNKILSNFKKEKFLIKKFSSKKFNIYNDRIFSLSDKDIDEKIEEIKIPETRYIKNQFSKDYQNLEKIKILKDDNFLNNKGVKRKNHTSYDYNINNKILKELIFTNNNSLEIIDDELNFSNNMDEKKKDQKNNIRKSNFFNAVMEMQNFNNN